MEAGNRMSKIFSQKCFIHSQREAVAKCLQCGRFFCRECVTEHKRQLICASCLVASSQNLEKKDGFISFLFRVLLGLAGIVFLWYCLFHMGNFISGLPASFHEGTIWYNK